MPTCQTCGAPNAGLVCPDCTLCGDLLSPHPEARLRALRLSGPDDRPKVMAAAMRGGHLFEDVSVGGEDLGVALLAWLQEYAPTLTWLRWIAEDARWGHTTQARLARQEPDRALLRLPEWVCQSGARPEPLVRALGGLAPDKLATVAFRLGSCGVPYARWKAGVPEGAGLAMRVGAAAAEHTPTASEWKPARLDRDARRWPIARREDGLPLCCGLCGETLPATGPCAWCGTSPEDEPPMAVRPSELLKPRKVCATCGFDQATALAPARCGDCGAPAAR